MVDGIGKSKEIDQQVLQLLTEESATLGNIHLGFRVKQVAEQWLALSGKANQPFIDGALTIQFGELYVTNISDDRLSAPTKSNIRTHSYMLDLYLELDVGGGQSSYLKIREMVQKVMDLLMNNPRPTSTGNIDIITPADVGIDIDRFSDEFAVWRATISFNVTERIGHG